MARVGPPLITHALVTVALLATPNSHAQGQTQVVPAGQARPGTANSQPDQPTTGTAAISGVIKDAITGRPLAGATVSLRRWMGGSQLPRAVTDARGRFVFRNLPPADNYFLDAGHFGYSTTRYGWTGPDGPLTLAGMKLVPLTDGQWINTIEIPLWRLGSISGRIIDERNEPVVGVTVRAFSIANIAGHSQMVGGPLAVTDDRGVYRLADLTPASYRVGVLSVQSTVPNTTAEAPQQWPVGELESGGIGAASGSKVSAPGIDVDGKHRLVITNFATPPPPSADQMRAYPAVFYPGVRTPDEAASIDIGYGEDRSGLDVQLRPVPAVRIVGRVEGYSGAPPQMMLRLMPVGSERLGFGSEAATSLVERDGTFTFLNVPEGNYTILAQASVKDFTTGSPSLRLSDPPGFPGGGRGVGSSDGAPGLNYLAHFGAPLNVWGRMTIAVGDRDVTGIVVDLHPTVTVRGRIVYGEGMKPPANGYALVNAEPANGDPALGQFSGQTDRDGSFRFAIAGLMAGSYLIQPAPNVVSVTWQGRDVTESGLDASTGRDFDDVIITLTDKATNIGGFVNDPRATGDARSTASTAVIAFPVDSARWTNYGWAARRFRTAYTASNGSYSLTRLPAGDYYVIAVDASKIDAWVNPAFLAAAAPLATKITIDWGGKVTQDLSFKEVNVK